VLNEDRPVKRREGKAKVRRGNTFYCVFLHKTFGGIKLYHYFSFVLIIHVK